MAAVDGHADKEKLDRGTIMALVALALAVFLVANDFTALSVALPNMEADLNADVGTIQWVINAYALVFGVLIISGGRLADMFGRRRIFFIGAAIFATFSTLAGAAPNADLLIAGRALMGIGGAMMWPAVLGLTYQVLPDSRQGLAGPLVMGVAGLGNACGPLLGGLLTDAASWRWVLLINLPIAAGACAVTYFKVAAAPGDPGDGRIDYAGSAALTVGLVALLLALDQATDWGWGDWRILAMLAVCVISLLAFIPIEHRAGAGGLIPPDVARNRTFVAACAAVLLMSATFFAMLLYVPQVMAKVMGFSALESGVGFLPLMGTFSIAAFLSGPLYERIGGKLLLTIGSACIPVGLFLLTLCQVDSRYLVLVPGLVVAGVGVGLFYSTMTTVAITALDQARASLAGGILYMFQVAGGSVGLGLTTTIFTATALSHVHSDAVADRLSSDQEHAVVQVLSGNETGQHLLALFPQLAGRLEELAREALIAGFHTALRVDVALAVASFLITLLFIGDRRRRRREPAATAAPAGPTPPAARELTTTPIAE
jgi:EmrB/QacA subfamily drug resistance transporter